MARFDYTRAQSIPEALELLSDPRHTSRPVAGGTDLMVYVRHEQPGFDRLVDITRIPELQGIALVGGQIHIGAAVTFSEAADSPLLQEEATCLVEACRSVGGPAIRNSGTLGGNVVNAAACADSLPPLACMEAVAHLQSAGGGARSLPVAELVVDANRSALQPGELLTHFTLPLLPLHARSTFIKLGRRNAQAISRLSIAAAGRLDEQGKVDFVRIASGAATPRVQRYSELEAFLLGRAPEVPALQEAARLCSTAMVAITGRRWSTEYKETAIQGMAEQILRRVFCA